MSRRGSLNPKARSKIHKNLCNTCLLYISCHYHDWVKRVLWTISVWINSKDNFVVEIILSTFFIVIHISCQPHEDSVLQKHVFLKKKINEHLLRVQKTSMNSKLKLRILRWRSCWRLGWSMNVHLELRKNRVILKVTRRTLVKTGLVIRDESCTQQDITCL